MLRALYSLPISNNYVGILADTRGFTRFNSLKGFLYLPLKACMQIYMTIGWSCEDEKAYKQTKKTHFLIYYINLDIRKPCAVHIGGVCR